MSDGKHVPLLFRKANVSILQTRLTDSMCNVLFILGVVGNVFGLLIFSSSRRSWRISSLYTCLATCSSITNLLCLIRYASILNSSSRHILHQLVGQKWWACKLYEFSFSFRVISSWITLFWMSERLMCISRKLRSYFNRRISFKVQLITVTMIVIIVVGCVVGLPVYMFEPQILIETIANGTINITRTYCGLHPDATIKWQIYYHEVRFGRNHHTIRSLFSELIPTGAIIIFNTYIIYHLHRIYRRLYRIHGFKLCKKQSRTTSWMNNVLILHSCLFLGSLLSHVVGHFIIVEGHETWWMSLAILVNCSLNFYVYCLSGEAFRNEIGRFILWLRTVFYKLSSCHDLPQRSFYRKNLTHEINYL